MSDCRKIAINGYVTIKNGNKIIVDRGKNAIVRQGMRHIVGCMTYNSLRVRAAYYNGNAYFYGAAHAPYIRFGKGGLAPTTQLMDALVLQISAGHNTFVNVGAISSRNGGNNIFTKFTASWHAGVLNSELIDEQQLSELGIFFGLFDKFGAGDDIENIFAGQGSNTSLNKAEILFSRFSLGDAAFVPDSSKPVLVDWEFGWEFI